MDCDETALEKLIIGNEAFDEIEHAFDRFCPFEAVGMVRQEVRHGHFLSYILDPQRPHGFGSECLRALMNAATKAAYSGPGSDLGLISPLDAHLMDFELARVKREWRNIDLLVEVPSERLVVAIELKIDASEHSGQLGKYRRVVEQSWPSDAGWRQLFIFLTKRGDEPSDEDGAGWVSVELDALACELDAVANRKSGSDDARQMLSDYLTMLRRHHLSNDRLEELASKLWAQHREALDFLMDQRPDATGELFRRLYDQRENLAARMSEAAGVVIEPDHCTPSLLRFAAPAWDALPGMLDANWTTSKRLILIEVAKGGKGNRTISVRFVLGRGNAASRQNIYDALRTAGVVLGVRGTLSPEWNRLARKNLVVLPEEGEFDPEQQIGKLGDALAQYAREHVQPYDKAMASLGQLQR